jgi:glycosyltransferase involved in cell wall biosynthesis
VLSIAIVDNASTDNSVERLRDVISPLPNVRLLAASEWLGYFGAAQWAIDTCQTERGAPFDWVIVSNNDVIIENRHLLELILDSDSRNVGVIAPSTRSLKSGLDQNPFMEIRPDRWRMWQLRLWLASYRVALVRDWLSRHAVRPMRRRYRAARSRFMPTSTSVTGRRYIYAPHGTFLIFSPRFFVEGGFLDSTCGLCREEIMVAEMCRRLHLPVLYEPALEVLHNEHSTVGSSLTRSMYEFHRKALTHISSRYMSDLRWRPSLGGEARKPSVD